MGLGALRARWADTGTGEEERPSSPGGCSMEHPYKPLSIIRLTPPHLTQHCRAASPEQPHRVAHPAALVGLLPRNSRTASPNPRPL